MPKMYYPNKSMSAVEVRTYNLRKCLTKSFSVNNSLTFIKRIKDLCLLEGEILISFVPCSLFPSVPVSRIFEYLGHLKRESLSMP